MQWAKICDDRIAALTPLSFSWIPWSVNTRLIKWISGSQDRDDRISTISNPRTDHEDDLDGQQSVSQQTGFFNDGKGLHSKEIVKLPECNKMK
jgi:hypothetical protein